LKVEEDGDAMVELFVLLVIAILLYVSFVWLPRRESTFWVNHKKHGACLAVKRDGLILILEPGTWKQLDDYPVRLLKARQDVIVIHKPAWITTTKSQEYKIRRLALRRRDALIQELDETMGPMLAVEKAKKRKLEMEIEAIVEERMQDRWW